MSRISIRGFFRGRKVLLTGATGFLGKAILEKLLFDVPEVERIRLLIRSKRGEVRSARVRFEREVVDSPIFSRLRRRHGSAFETFLREKVEAVPGELTRELLGMDSDSYRGLAENTDVVIHSAATVSFDERLDLALALNTIGAGRVAEFASDARARALVHISTCYVSGTREGDIPEVLLPIEDLPPRPPTGSRFALEEQIREIQEECTRIEEESRSDSLRDRFRKEAKNGSPETALLEEVIEERRQVWLREHLINAGMRRARRFGWNDTYTYTKALGEQLVARKRGKVPTCILRPAIIESGYVEPEPGWIDSLRMADPVVVGYGRGTLNDFPGNPDAILDLIPLDFVVNAALAAASGLGETQEIRVCHVATGEQNPLTLRHLSRLAHDYFLHTPFVDEEGRPIRTGTWSFPTVDEFSRKIERKERFLRLLGSVLAPLQGMKWASRLRQKAERLVGRLERVKYYAKIYAPYTNLCSRYRTENLRDFLARMDPEEAARFLFDPDGIDWERYVDEVHIPGVKRFVLKMRPTEFLPAGEPLVGLPESAAESHARASTIPDFLYRSVYRFPEKVALQVRRGGVWQRFTYRETFLLAGHVRQELTEAGIRAGDRVILWAENQPEWAIGYLGVVTMGATAVPLDYQRFPEEVWEIARITGAGAVLTTDDRARRLRTAVPGDAAGSHLPVLLDLQAWGAPFGTSPHSLGLNVPPPVAVDSRAIASILFTSGTTVAPKGVPLTHRNLVSNVFSVAEIIPPREEDQFLSILPLHHALEFTACFLMSLFSGATVTYLETLNAATILEMMQKTGTSVVIGVPRLIELFWARIGEQTPGFLRFALEPEDSLKGMQRGLAPWVRKILARKVRARFGGNIRVFVTGGAAITEEVVRGFLRLGLPICEGYGLTETSPVLTVNPVGRQRAGTAGPALPDVELRIHEADPSGVGEILVRGPNVMDGYLDRPDLNRECYLETWFRTRDLGSLDRDGYLRICGRMDDLIVTAAGKNVYPDEVETLYKDIPGVKEFCVVGIKPPERSGAEIHAVIHAPGVENHDEKVLHETIRKAFEERSHSIPTFQRVQKIHFIPEDLPKTATLKVRRSVVRKRIEDRLEGRESVRTEDLSGDRYMRGVLESLARLLKMDRTAIGKTDRLQTDLGLDSLARVDLVAEIEHRFGIRVPDERAEKWETVEDVVADVRGCSGGGTR